MPYCWFSNRWSKFQGKNVVSIHTLKLMAKKSLTKLRLCGAARSRSGDVTARGGADLPRRLCAAHLTLLLLKPVANFKSSYMSSDRATLEHHQRPWSIISSSTRRCSGGFWKLEGCALRTCRAGSLTTDWCILVHFTLPYVVDVLWVVEELCRVLKSKGVCFDIHLEATGLPGCGCNATMPPSLCGVYQQPCVII